MKHHFEYRIGRHAIHSREQWESAPGATTSDAIRYLETVEPAEWGFSVYACIIDEAGEVIKISKYPCQVLSTCDLGQLKEDIGRYNKAAELPVFNRDKFNTYNYFIINSDELDQNAIDHAIQDLDEGKD